MPDLRSAALRASQSLHARALKASDSAAQALGEAMRRLAVMLEDGITTRAEWDAYGMAELLGMAEAAIRDSGVGELFAQNFGKAAVDFSQIIDKNLSVVNFGQSEATALQAAVDAKYAGWEATVDRAVTDLLRNQVASATLVPISAQSIRANLVGNFGGIERHAMTYAQTAVETQLRETWIAAGENAGVERYEYEGPDDLITRPFCKKLLDAGGDYTIAEIQEMDNEKGLPVLTAGGGWNCRHMWRPVF